MPTFDTPGPVALAVTASPPVTSRSRPGPSPRVDVEVTPCRGDEGSQQAAAETRIEAVERGGRHEIVVRAPKREGRFVASDGAPSSMSRFAAPRARTSSFRRTAPTSTSRGRLGDVDAKSASGDATLGDTGA